MVHVTVTIQDLGMVDAQGEDEMVEYALDTVGEFASGLGVDLDITEGDLSVTAGWVEIEIEIDGAPEDVALFSRRWNEEY